MTEEEHHARAMLMGATYMPKRGWYTWFDINSPPFKRVDAITLEPITDEEHEYRVKNQKFPGPWYQHREDQ